MEIDIYLHSSKEQMWDAGEKAGLRGDALLAFRFTGCEHKMTYEVDEAGSSTLIAVDDRKLEAISGGKD